MNKSDLKRYEKIFDSAGVSKKISRNWLRNKDPNKITTRVNQIKGFVSMVKDAKKSPRYDLVKDKLERLLKDALNQADLFDYMRETSSDASLTIGFRA